MTGTAAGAAALLVASAALFVLSKVVKSLGKLSLGELAKGLGAMAASLLFLVPQRCYLLHLYQHCWGLVLPLVLSVLPFLCLV